MSDSSNGSSNDSSDDSDGEVCDGKCLPQLGAPAEAAHDSLSHAISSAVSAVSASLPTPFGYLPIQSWQIRLLRLHTGSQQPALAGELLHATLVLTEGRLQAVIYEGGNEHVVQYTALSYTWGPPDFTEQIKIHGRPLAITPNLAEVLRMLRDSPGIHYYWIDAICINQQDLDERAKQVSNMLHIFRIADTVCVWLGPSTDQLEAAITYLHKLWRSPAWRRYDQVSEHIEDLTDMGHSEACLANQKRVHSVLLELYTLPWLRRAWVRQEVFAAQEIVVRCGQHRLLWAQFGIGSEILSWTWSTEGKSAHQILAPVADLFESTKSPIDVVERRRNPRDLASVLAMSATLKATDERDLVHAILGMCAVPTVASGWSRNAQGWTAGFDPDYRSNMGDLWRRLTLYMLSRDGSCWTEVLNFSKPRRGKFRDEHTISSWIMDWRHSVSSSEIDMVRFWIERDYLDQKWHICYLPAKNSRIESTLPPKLEQTSDYSALLLENFALVGVVIVMTRYSCGLEDICGNLHAAYGSPGYWDNKHAPFDPAIHDRKIAFIQSCIRRKPFINLSQKETIGDALLPCTAQAGDLIFAGKNGLLPIVLRPKTPVFGSLFKRLSSLHIIDRKCYSPITPENKSAWRDLRGLQEEILRNYLKTAIDISNGRFEFIGPAFAAWLCEDFPQSNYHMDVRIV